MNLRVVEAFYWVVTLKSVTRAAEKLHITQSAMSSRIAALEQELGMLLLDRRDRQFRVTPAGQRFVAHAERLLALQREIKADLGAGSAQAVTLRVGAIESVLHSWLLDWVRALRTTEPLLALELTVETTPVLVDQLARGALDIAVAAMPGTASGVHSQPLPSMAMAFVGHAQRHRRRRWTLAELAAGELMTFQRGSQPHVALLDVLHRAGLEPLRIHRISSISAMAELVDDGFGVATLPLVVADLLRRRLPLKVLACDTPLPPLPIHVSWRDDPAAGAERRLVDSLLAHVGSPPLLRSRASKKSMT